MDNVEKRIATEKRIVRQIIKDALAAGYKISVHDGEEWVVSGSTKGAEVFAAMFATDEETLLFRSTASKVGHVNLVYGNGNGTEVICDYSDNEKTNAILAGALTLADQIDARMA